MIFDQNSSLATSLEAYWKLEESSGNRASQVGTWNLAQTGTVGNATGVSGNAASVTAINSYLEVARSGAIDPASGSFSFVFLFRVNTGHTGDVNFFDANGRTRFGWSNGSNVWQAYVYDGATLVSQYSQNIAPGGVYARDTWHMAGVTVDRGTSKVRFYRGANYTEHDITGLGSLGGGNLRLFANLTTGTPNCLIDEFGYWSRALSSAEMTTLLDSGNFYTFTPTTVSMSATPSNIPAGLANQTVTLIGNNTAWNPASPPVFTISGVSGSSITNRVVNSPTNATLTITTGASLGTATITDPVNSITTNLTVEASTYASGVNLTVPSGFKFVSQGSHYQAGMTHPSGTELNSKGYVYLPTSFVGTTLTPTTSVCVAFWNSASKDITLECAIQRQESDTPTRIQFGGQNSVVVTPGQYVVSDNFVLGTIQSDGYVPFRTYLSWTGSGISLQFPDYQGGPRRALGTGYDKGFVLGGGNRLLDPTLEESFTALSDGSNYVFSPFAMFAQGYTGANVLVYGDSISTTTAINTGSWIHLAFPQTPYLNTAQGGDALNNFMSAPGVFATSTATPLNKSRLALIPHFSNLFNAYGHNDLYDRTSTADRDTYLANVNALFSRVDFLGKGYQWTLPPDTTKAGGTTWANVTPAQQTPRTGSSLVVETNQYLRNSPSTYSVDAIMEVAGATRAPGQDDTAWKIPDYTSDGIHPGTGFAAPVAAIAPAQNTLRTWLQISPPTPSVSASLIRGLGVAPALAVLIEGGTYTLRDLMGLGMPPSAAAELTSGSVQSEELMAFSIPPTLAEILDGEN